MNVVGIQEALRKELRRRIAGGELTGMELARRTGFTQAHISNFLNRKRGLKLSALDRTLKAVGLTFCDLLNPRDLARLVPVPAEAAAEDASVPVVAPEVAAGRAVIIREEILFTARYRRSLLGRIRPDLAAASRRSWTRFVALEVDAREALLLSPRTVPGALLLVDRHYTTLRPYRKNERNLYAVRKDDACIVRFVETAEASLVLRSFDPDAPVEIAPISEDRAVTDFLVGRIAHLSTET